MPRRTRERRHQLLLADSQRGEQGSGRQLKADIVENFLTFSNHFALLENPKAHFLVAQKKV